MYCKILTNGNVTPLMPWLKSLNVMTPLITKFALKIRRLHYINKMVHVQFYSTLMHEESTKLGVVITMNPC
jgi:hypothetical protein